MQYQWYPGHMTKAKRQMSEDLKLIDIVIELLDARAIRSSQNPDIATMAKDKKRLILLNKADLADPGVTTAWIEYFKEQGIAAIPLDSRNRSAIKTVMAEIDSLSAEKQARDRARGIKNRPVRAMIVGIPNVGKSTFINSFARKASAKTGNKPGVTKGKQWITISKSIELLDTPGILWPKFDDEEVGINLAIIGSINDQLLEKHDLAQRLYLNLSQRYDSFMEDRYGFSVEDSMHMLEEIAESRNLVAKGARPDLDKAAFLFIDEYRSGMLGRLSLEIV